MPRAPDPDESGILLRPGDYPRIKRKSEGRPEPEAPAGPPWKERLPWKRIGIVAGVGVVGLLFGLLVASGGGGGDDAKGQVAAAAAREKALAAELATARTALDTEKQAAAKLAADKAALEPKAEEASALQQKLAAAVGQQGEVTAQDGEIRLQLVDKILFRTGEADLTKQGQAVLSSVGAALNDPTVADKQIWVQGHTDDDPIAVPKPAKPAKPAKGKGKPPVPPPAPTVRFASNWELSAARALTVVHYLQDQVKVDPRRLAAVAFGQYRPASKVKAKNRRIEIVLYPRHSIGTPK